jgi:hypothetical protein
MAFFISILYKFCMFLLTKDKLSNMLNVIPFIFRIFECF